MSAATNRQRSVFHLIAFSTSLALLTILPLVFFHQVLGSFGGPLNYLILPFMSTAAAFVVSLIVFFPLSLLAEKYALSRWFYITGILAGAAALAFTASLAGIQIDRLESFAGMFIITTLGYGFCLYFIGGFFIYLGILIFGRHVQSLRDANNKPKQSAC